MRVLFVHQNLPGQFGRLAQALAAEGAQVVFLTQRGDRTLEGVGVAVYRAGSTTTEPAGDLRQLSGAVRTGHAAARSIAALAARGFTPDVVVGHPGWGELLFVKDVLPGTPLLAYCEFHFPQDGVPLGPGPPLESLELRIRRRLENAHLLMSLSAADRGWSPTAWQRDSFPADLREKIEVVFEGVDTAEVRPSREARFQLGPDRTLAAGDEVLTYVARGLEPHRGFPQFVRALPRLLAERPRLQVVIAGAEEAAYGPAPAKAASWRQLLAREVKLDAERVHFTGWLARERYLALLQVSRVHLHLTVPFVLSWSFFEALAAGCLVVGSDTAPVREVLEPGRNGLIAPLHDPAGIADAVLAALSHQGAEKLRASARETVEARYSASVCLPRQIAMVRDLAAGSAAKRDA